MLITKESFGVTAAGESVERYWLQNASGVRAGILTYGGTIQSLLVPDRYGELRDVVLGFDSMERYEAQRYCGALIGRCANRIPGGNVEICGQKYTLSLNDTKAPTHLHGGFHGFHQKIWQARCTSSALELRLLSPDGEDGYPGTLRVCVKYSLQDDDTLTIEYSAVTDKPTLASFTNHAYFNLEGHDAGSIRDHLLTVESDLYTENGPDNAATGAVLHLAHTPLDFRSEKALGPVIDADYPPIRAMGGIDLNFIIDRGREKDLRRAALLRAPESGICMEVLSTELGLQVYTANMLTGSWIGKSGKPYPRHSGICLETQMLPNAASHAFFPSPILFPDQEYRHRACYRFTHAL